MGRCKTEFCNDPCFFYLQAQLSYLQSNAPLSDNKSTILVAIFTFPQTESLSNIKSQVMRGQTYYSRALGYIPRSHGGSLALELAYTRPYTVWRKVRRRVSRAHFRQGFCGTFLPGLPECIRQSVLPCRGPHLCLLVSKIRSAGKPTLR